MDLSRSSREECRWRTHFWGLVEFLVSGPPHSAAHCLRAVPDPIAVCAISPQPHEWSGVTARNHALCQPIPWDRFCRRWPKFSIVKLRQIGWMCTEGERMYRSATASGACGHIIPSLWMSSAQSLDSLGSCTGVFKARGTASGYVSSFGPTVL